ncbi:Uncharacterized protein APZ42_033580 [Daphnia magna]|uniref:Uncharacterized protein n=1 Tax=Daphnia magna TaxID=35525 RepID=A0A164KYH0_9CRUS|nr:Uncharacterized protein APZ42_033580 [Daphnia magna]
MQGCLAAEAVLEPTSIDDLQPIAGSSLSQFHTSQDISIRNYFKSDDSELLAIIQEVEAQFPQSNLIIKSGYSRNYEEYQESETIWKKRIETEDRAFQEQRRHLFKSIEEKMCFTGTFLQFISGV